MSRIAILLPTRKRPEQLKRFLNSLAATASNKHNFFTYLYVDEDDKETDKVVLDASIPLAFQVVSGPRITMSDMANKLYEKRNTDYEMYFLAGDDLIMETVGWDERLIKAYESLKGDKIALFYGDDDNTIAHPPKFATHPILTKEWIETLGYVQPPYFVCDYADTWLNYIADSVQRKIEVPIKHPHLHYTVGKAPVDSTYKERREEFYKQNVPHLYESKIQERIDGVVKLWSKIHDNKSN